MVDGRSRVSAVSAPVDNVMCGAQALLLDFDGPVCRVFAGHSSVAVAAELRRCLEGAGIELPERFAANRDPLKLLQWVGESHPERLGPVEDRLIEGETRAISSAAPTVGAAAVIHEAHRAGWPVAIVSNNGAPAIERYLQIHELSDCITAVVGRPYGEPERMKPRPDIVRDAVESVGVPAESCVLVGDSPTDMTAAIAAGVVPIGYVKSPQRRSGLENAGAVALIDDMRGLLGAWVTA